MDFSNKFLMIQKVLNLSQKDLALKLGLSPLFIFSDGKDPISIS